MIAVEGDIDRENTAAIVDATAAELRGDPPVALMLDLSCVTFFGSAGVRALLQLRTLAIAGATHLIIRDPSSVVRRVLAIVDFGHSFDIMTSNPNRQR